MDIDLTGLAALFGAIAWPVAVAAIAISMRTQLAGLARSVGRRMTSVKVGSFSISLEAAAAKEMTLEWGSLGTDVRQLTSTAVFDSATSTLFEEIARTATSDYSVIDLGTGSSWLTSRLYVFAVLLGQLNGTRAFVFTETRDGRTGVFSGVATPEEVRIALARAYPWLEGSWLQARAQPVGDVRLFGDGIDLRAIATTEPWQINGLVTQYIQQIQADYPPPDTDPTWESFTDSTTGQETWERTAWIDSVALQTIMGEALTRQSYVHSHDESDTARTARILRRPATFVAAVDGHERFLHLVDRGAILRKIAPQIAERLTAEEKDDGGNAAA